MIALAGAQDGTSARWLFTAPWDPVVVRRGDALGLRAFADQLADGVAPGMSNRVRDGRWVTVLAWCVARSYEVFHARGGRSVDTRAAQLERYGWLRPLELMWVGRTIALAKDWRERSLAGQRSVRPWYEDDEQATERFGMSSDQFRAYRQTGMYGGYRLAFRKWAHMTAGGDGWTPARSTRDLADWLDGKLGGARPPWPLHHGADHDDSPLTRVPKLGKGDKHDWWLRHWPDYDRRGRNADENTLPRRRDDHRRLPERDLLEPIVFSEDSDGKRRRAVVLEVSKASASTHFELCEHLSDAFPKDRSLGLLPAFSRLADAGIDVMELVADALGEGGEVELSKIVARTGVPEGCGELASAAQAWRSRVDAQVRHVETVHRFASAIPKSRTTECLKALLAYHEAHGGGLRWFVLRKGKVEARSRPAVGSSRYRFRLSSLCRLASQCGVRTMPDLFVDGTEGEGDAEEADE